MVKSVSYVNLAPCECWSLLRGSVVGRVVYTYEAMPAVALVNYALVGELIVFAVGERSKLAGLLTGQVVAFEVDDVDPAAGTGWSLVMIGRTGRVADTTVTDSASSLAMYPSALDGPEAYVGLAGEKVTGRVWGGFGGSRSGPAVCEVGPGCDDAQSG